MNDTLTIRLPSAQRKALRARSAATGRSESEIVRDLIARQLQEKDTLGERAGRHFGRLDFTPAPADGDAWRAHLLRANVRS